MILSLKFVICPWPPVGARPSWGVMIIMKRKLRGLKRTAIQLDFNLYRVNVPIRGLAQAALSVIDLQPEGVKKTIMLVHGYAGCAETWEHQINHFVRSYRVVAPDLRGHGQSDAPLTQYTMPELVADLDTIVTELDFPEKFVLVGHSFGGSIGVEYANAYPERLEKLVLIATAAEYPLPRQVAWVYRLPTTLLRPWWKYRPRWNAALPVMKRMMLNNLSQWQGWPLLRNISLPTLVITGERDSYFPRYVFDDLAKMIPGAETYDVGSAKHKVQLERHQAVNRTIERFIGDEQHRSWRDHDTRSDRLLGQRPWLAHYSQETPLTVPIPPQPLPKFLEGAADWMPRRTATIFYGSRLSYQQLNCRVNQFAQALHGLGIRPGDRVMVVLPNMPQLIIAYYGILKIGGVVVMSNPEADAAQIGRQIKETGAKVLVTLQDFAELAKAIQADTALEKIILADIRNVVSAGVYKKLMARWGVDDLRALDGPQPLLADCLLMSDLMQAIVFSSKVLVIVIRAIAWGVLG